MLIYSTTKKVCSELALRAVDLFMSLEERIDLGIGEAVGAPLPDHPVSNVFVDNASRRIGESAQRLQPAPIQY